MAKATKKPVDLDTFLCVVWTDAVVAQGWENQEEAHTIHPVRSVGWLIKETRQELVLAADVSVDGLENEDSDVETNRRIAIPKSWIISRKKTRFGTG